MTEQLYIPAPLGGTNDRMLAAYADALRGHVVAGFRILEAIVEFDWLYQLGGDYIKTKVVIDDPPEGMEIWPSDRLSELRDAVASAARQFAIVEHVYVRPVYLRNMARVGLPGDVISRARAAADRPFEPEQA